MSEWKQYKLGEIADVRDGTHDSPKQKEFGKPLVTSKHIKGGKIDLKSAYLISHEDFTKINKRSKVNKWDVLFSMIGTIGEMVIVESETDFAIKNVGLFKTGDEKLSKWIYYYLKSPDAQKEIEANLKGSTQQYISLTDLRNFPINIPSDESRNEIIEILSSLDDKIEINNQINQNLEVLAQAIFKQWFVDFEFPNENGEPYKSSGGEMVDSELGEIPKGWEVKRLDELELYISDLVANGSFASIKSNVSTSDSEGYALFVRNTDLKNRFKVQKIYVDKNSYDFLKKTPLYGGEIIIPNVGDVGTVHLCPRFNFPMTLGNNCILVKSFNMQYWLYTFFKSNEGFNSLRRVVVGSVQDKLSKTNFKSIKIVLPTESLLRHVEEILKENYFLQESYLNECERLENLRDFLLPKLISGELEINDVNLN